MPAKPANGRRQRSSSRQSGLTLIEMLVAMVILGFMMALVSEVVYQVSQVARAANSVTSATAARWSGGWSASALFANLMAPEEAGENAPMTGTPQRITGYSAQPLDGSTRGIQPFKLELRRAERGDGTEMLAASTGAAQASPEASLVAVFPGRAEFAFVDRAGDVRSIWPPTDRDERNVETLPQAVVVRDPQAGVVLMWYGFEGEPGRQRSPRNSFASNVP